MAPQELLKRIVAIFPDFAEFWDDPSNCSRDDDGSFTLHGIFIVLTSFFRERYQSFTPEQFEALGTFVSECMLCAEDPDLANAAATCFVENIAGEECDRDLAQHLTGEALRYFRAWGDKA